MISSRLQQRKFVSRDCPLSSALCPLSPVKMSRYCCSDCCSACGSYSRESDEEMAAVKISAALYPIGVRLAAQRYAAGMETRELSAEVASARSALKGSNCHSDLDTAIWVLAAQNELKKRGVRLAHEPVMAVIPTTDCWGVRGNLSGGFYPDRAIRFAVATRQKGLGLTLERGTLRCGTRLPLGEAERLFFFTPDQDL